LTINQEGVIIDT